MSRADIWNATPPHGDSIKLANLPEPPENYDELYSELDLQVERIPPLEEVIVKQAEDQWTNSLADVVGKVCIRGHYMPSIEHENQYSTKFDPIESLNIYMYLQLSPNGQTNLSRKSKWSDGFCDSLDISKPVSQPTVGRIKNRVQERTPSWADYFDRVCDDVFIQVQGTEYEDWFDDPPTVTFDGGAVPEVKKISRRLRRYIYPFIKLNRGHDTKYSKDKLLKILAAAGRWGCQPNQAADAMELKDWNHGQDVPDSASLFYNIWPMKMQQVMEMFIVCHEALFRLASRYESFGGDIEVAIDITDWPTFGDPNASNGISGTKPERNFSHAWQYATLSLVGDRVPMTLAAIPVQQRKNANIAMRKLFTYADSKFDIDRVYLDSGFYETKFRKVCDDFDMNFVIKAKEQADAVEQSCMLDLADGRCGF
ncbi:hypothetical protein [Haloarcula sebkhae]|uniref:Uncharacterized protein n=2 Tax=Haloarcula sebkhae TaxID=932660 RepID=A0ACC6VMF2_9EURY|nr:hypothetical protein [Haloarcula sebkhae]GGK84067.1 hypothetical protein GCM10009067_40380 [Haloarcula sebkhae]